MSTMLLFLLARLVILIAPPPEARETLISLPTLTGVVHSAKDGAPLQEASVFVYTAKPRQGTSSFCPSCYPECGKHVETDESGRFTISSLNPKLIYRILVVAKNHQAQFKDDVDPTADPIEVQLQLVNPARLNPSHVVSGRVIDSDGSPVMGATLEVEGATTKSGTHFGNVQGVDPLAVTDAQGEFVITSSMRAEQLLLIVKARGLANRVFPSVGPDAKNELRLLEGATVRGRLVKDGEPVPNVEVGMVQTSRTAEKFVGHFEIGTDKNGRFEFSNIPANDEYFLYGRMETLHDIGAVPVRTINTGPDREELDVGDIEVGPSHRISGQVVLSDGQPIPPHTRLLIGRRSAWDALTIELDSEGRFDATGLPSESYSLSIRVKGYSLSPKNYSLDLVNEMQLIGMIDRDSSGIQILLEPGARPAVNQQARDRFDQSIAKEPLRGVEKRGE